ncbi:Mitochondrial ribosomal protein of the small subunit [Saccharomyces cerevisiae]|nr:Mitochondrial ribosomal protein of the small subunit [Saccharomyces boulardii (nom. inval.)]
MGVEIRYSSKIKSRYLVYNDLDTLERITTFEPRGGTQWNRLRFKKWEWIIIQLARKAKNSPNGVIQRTVVPGRILNVVKENNDNKWLAAIGGFVADVVFFQSPPSSFNSMGDFIRMKTFLFEILEASMEKMVLFRCTLDYSNHKMTRPENFSIRDQFINH